jgi:chromosome segregation ATPase
MTMNYNSNDSPNFINNNEENNNTNLNMTFNGNSSNVELFNHIEKMKKEIEYLNNRNTELEGVLLEKSNQIKKVSNTNDNITEEYNKLSAKHNALLIYSSDIQKKLDLCEIELNEKKEENDKILNCDWGKLLAQRDNIIKILKNELVYYKQEFNNLKNFVTGIENKKHLTDDNMKRIDVLLENYLQENKKYKKMVNI